MLEVGIRVVRGPDWKWGNQDSGEGHVGTIVEVGRPGSTSSPDKTVVVQWDMGSRTNYRVGYQEAFDLRLFDNAPAGVRHPNVICDGCKDHGISGMLWKCVRCFDFDLCTMCYMNDTHDLSHRFRRFDTASSVGVDLQPRQENPKVVSKGIFAGARVIRGPDWDWGNQDGGEGKVGRVVDIRGWDHESGRSVANVIWSSGSTNVYRLGHKGKVDLKCVQASSAGSYYVNHLPVLGMPTTTINRNSTSGLMKPLTVKHSFNVGDKVQVIPDVAKLKEMQEGHGGWNPKMAEFAGKIGTVHRVTDKGDIRVQYDTGIRWTINPAALTKKTSYSVGDTVYVLNNYAKVKELQKGHGEWVDVMKDILGKTGTIVKIYTDNDLRINFGSSVWTMNPLTVKLVRSDGFEANNSMYANANFREEISQDPMSSMLSHLQEECHMQPDSLDVAVNVERFVREAAQGRVETVKKIISKMSDKINHKSTGKTALQVSAHQGHMEIVGLLIAAGANLEISDDDGDTALHYSAFGNQPLIMDALLKAGALVDAVNKAKYTPLHISVNKQYLECVKILLRYRCNVNIQDSYGDTALHDAIGKDHRDIIHFFVNTPGTDFTLKNNRGFNVLHHAALKGNHYAVGKLLGKARQLVDVQKDDGFAALHLAVLNGHYLVAKTLIEDGQADINIRNNRKQTALTLSIAQGYSELVELLVSKGADISVEDEDGDTPLHTVLTRHFDSQVHQQSSHLPNPVVAMELKKLDNAPLIAEIFVNLVKFGWSPTDEETPAVALACFIIQAGADVTSKNRKGVTSLDLIRSDKLRDTLNFYSAHSRMRGLCITDPAALQASLQAGASKPEVPSTSGTSGIVPLVYGACSSSAAASTAPVMGNDVPAECMLCAEVTYLIYFDPCGHGVVCEECCIRMKKCVSCQQVIRRKVNRFGQSISAENRTSNTATLKTSAEPPRYNDNMCAEIEEAYYCPICMERRRNIVFLCGHGACEKCADALSKCHMCRTPIKQKINLY